MLSKLKTPKHNDLNERKLIHNNKVYAHLIKKKGNLLSSRMNLKPNEEIKRLSICAGLRSPVIRPSSLIPMQATRNIANPAFHTNSSSGGFYNDLNESSLSPSPAIFNQTNY